MNIPTDQQLLADYAGSRSEAAFTELVRRHVDLVHSAAWRMTGETHSAQDVTQAVFVALAQNAGRLEGHPVLSGWLHTTARNLAAKQVRAAVRRQYREQEAVAMNELLSTPDASWEEIAPQLDAALGELSEVDRDAVLLRYFQKKSAVEMAQILGISDDTAQKRVSRAVEKMRESFTRKKITIGAGGLAMLISANGVQSAPIGLAATISTAALGGTAVTTSTLIAATAKTIAMTTLQKTLITATLAVVAGAGIYEAQQAHDARAEVQTLQQEQTPLADQVQQLRDNYADVTNRLAGLLAENSRLQSNSNQTELLKLRGEITRFENEANDPVEKMAKAWLYKVNRLKEQLEKMPEAKTPELRFATEQDWLNAVKGNPLNSDVDYRRALSTLRGLEENKVGSKFQKALNAYAQNNNEQPLTDLSQLQPYLDPSIDDSILQRWEVTAPSTVKNIGVGTNFIITQKMPVDEVFDNRFVVGEHGFGSTDFLQSSGVYKTLQPVYQAYRAAHNGDWQNMSDLLPYATTPEEQAALQKVLLKESPSSE